MMDGQRWEKVGHWYDFLRVIAGRSWERKELLRCPMASQPKFTGELEPVIGKWYALGDTYSAWTTLLPEEAGRGPHVGSYGFNDNLQWMPWNVSGIRAGANVPVYIDCADLAINAGSWRQGPPAYEGYFDVHHPLGFSCINRHQGGVNCLFLDWSVRKVGLKELWTLKWNPAGWDTAGAWMRRGGVEPEDWPQWMRGFKDY